MKIVLCTLLICLILAPFASAEEACLPWFTDASITNAIRMQPSADAPALVSGGTIGNCLELTQPIGVTDSLLIQTRGIISFWLKPEWNGNDGLSHKFLSAGTPDEGIIIDKTAAGNLRFVMAGGGKVTALRSDVSNWQSGEWHHIMVAWIDKDNTPQGLAMWIDRAAVASCVYGGTQFFTAPYDQKVYIGDSTSHARMDELIFRDSFYIDQTNGATPIAYRDYFRTAPYTSYEITNKAQHIASDARAVVGYHKQFGVIATKVVNADTGTTTKEYITDSDGPTGSTWDTFDAKPYITWISNDTSKATVDSNGMVTGVATTTSPINLTAYFRNHTITYPLEVVSADQPDLDLMFVERTPKYLNKATKNWPYVNDAVKSVAHIGNFGTQPISNFKVKFEKITDTNGNYVLDANEIDPNPTIVTVSTTLQPGATMTQEFTWTWPATQTFIRITVDPDNEKNEICKANNQRCDLNTARAVAWGYGRDASGNGDTNIVFVNDYNNKVMNLVGSFSDYDWCDANVERLAQIMRESVWPTTSPVGILDSARVDNFMTTNQYLNDHEAGISGAGSYYDGGYEEMWDTRMTLSPGNIHEMGHNVLKLPDMYGHAIWPQSFLFTDENGKPYGNTPLIPNIGVYDDLAPWSSATWGYPDALGVGYSPLMVNNHPWLDKDLAGWVNYVRLTRKGVSDSDWATKIPSSNTLKLLDVNDNPLTNALIYIYQCTNTGFMCTSNKYYPGRPKFIGSTNGSGLYTISKLTSTYWDDWGTDANDGVQYVNTPFDRQNGVGAYGPSWQVGEMLLLRIVGADGQTEFETLPLSEFHIAYFSGNTLNATYTIKTSLTSPDTVPSVVPPTTQAAGQQPIARVRYNGTTYYSNFSINVPYSATQATTLAFDGSVSWDNENQPLYYRWDSMFGSSMGPTHQFTIPANTEAKSYDISFYVIDGIRYSNMFTITVNVVNAPMARITGKVTDLSGKALDNTVHVGIKRSPKAIADADYYLTTDSSGNYTSDYLPAGTYYVAAWRKSYNPTTDTVVNLGSTDVKADLKAEPIGTKMALSLDQLAASEDTLPGYLIGNIFDGDTNCGWAAASNPTQPVYFYIDLGYLTDVTWLSLYQYQYSDNRKATCEDYTVDVMSFGNPLDPASWQGNSTVRNVYSAYATMNGYNYRTDPIQPTNIGHDPIRLDATGVRGIRIGLSAIDYPQYEIKELGIYTTIPQTTIQNIKSLALNSSCKLGYKEVTAIPGSGLPSNIYYVQEPDWTSALRLDLTSCPVTGVKIGDQLSVTGTVKQTATGERYISATARTTFAATATIKPLGMNNNSVLLSSKSATGLLTKIWGTVENVTTTDFMLNTGDDGPNIRVICGSATKPIVGHLITVNGILSSDGTTQTLLMRSNDWNDLTP